MLAGNPTAEMTLLEHLQELRRRIIVSAAAVLLASVACYLLFEPIFGLLYRPFAPLEKAPGATLFINSIFEGFLVKVKLAATAGVILSFPVHLYNLVRFVFPGLLAAERRVVGWSLLASFLLVLASLYYGYFYIIPISIRFLTSAGFLPAPVGILLNYGKNIFYVLQFLLLTLLLFQVPIVVEILLVLNVLRRKSLLRASRTIIFAIFVVAAVFTPPDFISQLAVAVPLIGLFFLTILVAWIFRFGEGS